MGERGWAEPRHVRDIQKPEPRKGGVFKRPFGVWQGKSGRDPGHLKQALRVEDGAAKRTGQQTKTPGSSRTGKEILGAEDRAGTETGASEA